MSKNILALDIGTQSARAAVLSQDGDILAIGQIPHEVDSPQPGWAQQRPVAWWDETCRAIQQVLSETGVAPESIAAVASCGQMHGPVGIDEQGRVTTEWVQLWCDKRCGPQCEQVRRTHDESQLAAKAANPINPAWIALKVRWYKENQPAAYDRARWFLVPKDFINFKLTGVAATDPSEASGSFLWDCRQDAYCRELADAVEVDLGRFAPVSASHEVIGMVTEEAAHQTGLRPGTPVVAGGGDFPVSMLGFGIVGEGIASDVTGTSALFATHSPRPLIHPAVQNLRHAVDGWIPFTILDCGGLSMKWCKDLMSSARGDEVSFEKLIEMAADVPEGSDGLIFYPYMLGERRRENTSARGGYFGITLNHTAPHFVRAAMEGVALAMGRDVQLFRSLGLEVDRVLCVGGGARNALWNQIKADVLGVPLEISDEPEAGLKGAALLGAAGVGLIADPAVAARERASTGQTVRPRPESSRRYRAALEEFTRVYDHMLGFWQDERPS
ncbi:MAG TPA: FGGY family carbohydrate kinase [Thermoguttaceae bacterium]|nr:FGGY family carbohydrate kinase [Thermoguttaceae bacterium]